MVPAVGQGALAVEARRDDRGIGAALEPIHHPPTAAAVTAERAFLRGLGGGCQAPIAAHGEVEGDRLMLRGLVSDPQGSRLLRDTRKGSAAAAEAIGAALATAFLEQGAAALLATAPAPVTPFRPPARRS
jgi:hydroxymethylbilane synthase